MVSKTRSSGVLSNFVDFVFVLVCDLCFELGLKVNWSLEIRRVHFFRRFEFFVLLGGERVMDVRECIVSSR